MMTNEVKKILLVSSVSVMALFGLSACNDDKTSAPVAVEETAEEVSTTAPSAVDEATEQAKEKAGEVVEEVKEKAEDALDEAKKKAEKELEGKLPQ